MQPLEHKIALILWYYHNDPMYDYDEDNLLTDKNLQEDFMVALNDECEHIPFKYICSSCQAKECLRQAKLIVKHFKDFL